MKRDKKIIKLTPQEIDWYWQSLDRRIYLKHSTTWPEAQKLMDLQQKLKAIQKRFA